MKLPIVFVLMSKHNFYRRWDFMKYVLYDGKIGICPFTNFDNVISDVFQSDDKFNNIIEFSSRIIEKCDELWIFGKVDILASCIIYNKIIANTAKYKSKKDIFTDIKFFSEDENIANIRQILPNEVKFEQNVSTSFKKVLKNYFTGEEK